MNQLMVKKPCDGAYRSLSVSLISPSMMHRSVSLRFLRYALIGAATLSTVVAEGSSSSSTCSGAASEPVAADAAAAGHLENAYVNRNYLAGADGSVQQPPLQLLPQTGDNNTVLIRAHERVCQVTYGRYAVRVPGCDVTRA